MPTPVIKMTTAALNSLTGTTLGNLKPYQLEQVLDLLDRLKWERGSTSDAAAQPTIANIVTALGSNQP